MGFCVLITFGAWALSNWSYKEREVVYGSTPFLQVTNRQFSLFLWQNPEFMRQKIKNKRNYLEAWGDNLTVEPQLADQWVEAPDEALFLFHTWNRLIGSYYYPRPIPLSEFKQFLASDRQWHPKYWKEAPDGYIDLVKWIEEGSQYDDLKELSYQEMPLIIRRAFQGWKNFTKEGEKINAVSPSYRELWTFLENYENFKRPLWINLVRETRPNYLIKTSVKGFDKVPDDQLDGLIKVAIYNFLSNEVR